ncbi:acyl-CoA dehydrogenase family protein [soil metagenome]
MTTTEAPAISIPNTDYYCVDDYLSDDDRAIASTVRAFVDERVLPIINDYWERAAFPFELLKPFAATGVVGTTIDGYGCPGLSRLQSGLVAMELSRGDGSINTLNSMQSGLSMGTIHLLGDEDQKQRWLPAMGRLEKIGAFALTEPLHGSDAVALESTATRHGRSWIINGAKRWIGLGTIADLIVLWARDTDDGQVKAFVIEKDGEGNYPNGYEARVITGKIAKRAVLQADITLTDVRVPEENRLAGSTSFRDVSSILRQTRSNVAWEALGHALAAYDAAARYTQERVQFGKTIASFQLVQDKLSHMLADLTAIQLMTFRVAALQDQNRLTIPQASLAKMHASRASLEICRNARELMGGNGLLLENHVARHLTDMEVVHTYEGTESIQSLIVGRDITGISAFA